MTHRNCFFIGVRKKKKICRTKIFPIGIAIFGLFFSTNKQAVPDLTNRYCTSQASKVNTVLLWPPLQHMLVEKKLILGIPF
jgi:hypothetical protein